MTRATAFHDLGVCHAAIGRPGLCEFDFERHADFQNYLSGRAMINRMIP